MILHSQEALAAECKCPTPLESDAATDTTGNKSNKESSEKEEEEEFREVDPDQYCRYVTKIKNSLVIYVELKFFNLFISILLVFPNLFSLVPSPLIFVSLTNFFNTFWRDKMLW